MKRILGKPSLAFFGVMMPLALLLPSSTLAHQGHKIGAEEHPAIQARHKLMADSVFAAKQAGKMARGLEAYNAGKAELAMRLIGAAAFNMNNYFPKESIPKKGSKSESSPKIWKNMKDFQAEIKAFQSSSTQAIKQAGQGDDAFKQGFGLVMKSCKSCHEKYRIKKEK